MFVDSNSSSHTPGPSPGTHTYVHTHTRTHTHAHTADGYYFFAVVVPGGESKPNDGDPKVLSDGDYAPWPSTGTGSENHIVSPGACTSEGERDVWSSIGVGIHPHGR